MKHPIHSLMFRFKSAFVTVICDSIAGSIPPGHTMIDAMFHTGFTQFSIVCPTGFFVVYSAGPNPAFAQWSHMRI